ncbi:MAG: hypothetical protein V4564_22105, partial [Pseudomonadota bacterium]
MRWMIATCAALALAGAASASDSEPVTKGPPGWMTGFLSFLPAVPGLLALLLLPFHARAVILALRKAGKTL